MVSIRLQRTGRKKHAQFRMVVQDSRRAPTSGRVIAYLGYYNPHTKEHNLDFKQVSYYLEKGAQPSDRVIYILKANKIDLPKWVKQPTKLSKTTRHPDKLRKNQPETPVEAPTEDKPVASTDKPVEEDKPQVDESATEDFSDSSAEAKTDDQVESPVEEAKSATGEETSTDDKESTKTEAEAPANESAKEESKS